MRLHLEIGDAWGFARPRGTGDARRVARPTYARGVRLMACVDALRERLAVALPASDRVERERLTTLARTQLGGDYERMYAEGRTMSMKR